MNPPESICQELNRYLKKIQENPISRYAVIKGSIDKSQKCGCRYCYAACWSVGRVSDVEKNILGNHNAVVENSSLSFNQTESAGDKRDQFVIAEFRSSGLSFAGCGNSKEVFVVDRRFCRLDMLI
jgi:hypothetical protein